MSFESGPLALTIFRLPEKLPGNALELFNSKSGKKLDDIKGELSCGWVGGKHLLERDLNDETAYLGGHIYLNLRTSQRKIPAALLKAECRREELIYMQQNKLFYVPGKVRRTIKKEIEEKRLPQMPPQISGVPFVIDAASGTLYTGTVSTRGIDAFVSLFHETLKMEPVQIDYNDMMLRFFRSGIETLEPVSFSQEIEEKESLPGRDFLTWLWFNSEEKGGKLKVAQYGDFELMIDGPLTFTLSDEARGSAETVVRKGSPLRSAEAKAALSVGKKLKKAKFALCRDKEIWSGVFNAEQFSFSSLNLPESGEEKNGMDSAFEDRISYLHIFQTVFQEYFRNFVQVMKSDKWNREKSAILKWSTSRESY